MIAGMIRRMTAASAVLLLSVVGAAASVAVNVTVQSPAAPAPAPAPAVAVPPQFAAVEEELGQVCAACHGKGGMGGDRAPALVNSARLRGMSDADIGGVIRNGTGGGMPPFAFDDAKLAQFVGYIRSKNQATAAGGTPEQVAAGEAFFFGKGECAQCHMVRGRGGANGPDLSTVAARSTLEEMGRMLDDPDSQLGTKRTGACPGWAFCPDHQWSVVNVRMKDGATLRGFSRNEAEHDLQLQTFDGRMHMLTDVQYASFTREAKSYMPALKATATAAERRDLLAYLGGLSGSPLGPLKGVAAPVVAADIEAVIRPKAGEWPSYNGGPSGNRYSAMEQINRESVGRLKLEWLFAPGGTGLETTPVVVDGVMYVTGAKQLCALDARTGRSVWCAPRNSGQSVPAGGVAETPRQAGPAAATVGRAEGARPSAGVASGNGPSRGVAVLGDRVYFHSDDAYLVCLNRLTGGVMWTVPLTDPEYKGRYYATAAPLIVGDLIVSGMSGGDTPTRGSLVAFKAATGEQAWRFWTVPKPGEKLAETWKGSALLTGGSATWMTGSYDPDTDTLYWAVGNPYPSTDGDDRLGDNLYANSMLALDPKTGKLKWHYQFTPHDVHDWDATSPLLLVDAKFGGRDRKLVMQANRNGFFYVLDRITGQFLLGKQFVQKMTWASGIDAKGRPILIPGNEPTVAGVKTCPAVRGATNWFGTSYNPGTGLFYVMAAEDCGLYRKSGRIYGSNPDVRDPGKRFLRALDPQTARLAWEKPLTGSQEANYSGVLSTAGELVFHGETGGGFAAVDAKDGRTLWMMRTNDAWRATPMTYMLDGRQYVAVAAGSNILSFALAQ